MQKLVVVLGTNASGKSELGIRLANHFGGEVVSADSRQVYRGLDLGTGKITPAQAGSWVPSTTCGFSAQRPSASSAKGRSPGLRETSGLFGWTHSETIIKKLVTASGNGRENYRRHRDRCTLEGAEAWPDTAVGMSRLILAGGDDHPACSCPTVPGKQIFAFSRKRCKVSADWWLDDRVDCVGAPPPGNPKGRQQQ
jgi:hypothetical protein